MPSFPDSDTRNALEPGCARCPALAACRERVAWGNGALDADLVVVGEAPAAGDPDADRWQGGNWTGMAYTSRHSGRRVRRLVADLGFDPGDCYVTNAVKCYPRAASAADGERAEPASGDGDGGSREPTAEERRNCRAHLETELREVDPGVVLSTGKHATLAVLGDDALDDGFLAAVLEPVESSVFDVTVLPVLHPSYQDVWLSRLGYDYDEYVAEMRAAVEAAVSGE